MPFTVRNSIAPVDPEPRLLPRAVKYTIDGTDGAAAGILSRQHRMHPTIGDLISTAYYQDKLVNRTAGDDAQALPRTLHGLRGIPELRDQAILWLDLPWSANDATTAELGPAVDKATVHESGGG